MFKDKLFLFHLEKKIKSAYKGKKEIESKEVFNKRHVDKEKMKRYRDFDYNFIETSEIKLRSKNDVLTTNPEYQIIEDSERVKKY